MNTIIALSGLPGVGKDTTAQVIQRLSGNRFVSVRLAQSLIDMVKALDNSFENYDDRDFKNEISNPIWWYSEGDELIRPTNRQVLNIVANQVKAVNPHIFAEVSLDKYKHSNEDLLISDLRYKVEKEFLDKMYNHRVITILLKRDTGDSRDYSEDLDLEEKDFDYILDCSDVNNLVDTLDRLLKK